MKRFEHDEQTGRFRECDCGDLVRYDDARAVIDGLQALLNERDEKIEELRGLYSPSEGQYLNEIAREQLINIARHAASNCDEQHGYMFGAGKPGWNPHQWVLDAMRSVIGLIGDYNYRAAATRAEDLARKNSDTRKYLGHLIECAKGKPYIATGYLSDILERLR